MGEKFREFRLGTPARRWVRVVVGLAYFAWAVAFIMIGLQPSSIGAASGDSLSIPSIHLDTVTESVSLVDHRFTVPDRNVGVYYAGENKVFLLGHRATIFQNLKHLSLGDEISFAGEAYTVTSVEIEAKEDIKMSSLLAPASRPTIVLMTCHGTPLKNPDGTDSSDYTHRLIITATSSS